MFLTGSVLAMPAVAYGFARRGAFRYATLSRHRPLAVGVSLATAAVVPNISLAARALDAALLLIAFEAAIWTTAAVERDASSSEPPVARRTASRTRR